ncbi:hypothetical protein ACEQ8H_005195 [Pleosporales sp. CAS-2024a]
MAVLWGLDMRDLRWSVFSTANMWKNTDYHMRRTRFIVYQCATILLAVSQGIGTVAMIHYGDQQDFMEKQSPPSYVHNNNFIAVAAFNLGVGIFVSNVFGMAFFLDLVWPERKESPAVKLGWRICSGLSCVLTLACAIAYTYIVAAKSAYVTGTDAATAQRQLALYGGDPLRYRDNWRAVASVVTLWVGMVPTFAGTYLLWHSIAHIEAYGPKSKHARIRDGVEAPVVEKQEGSHDRDEDAKMQPTSVV